MGARTRFWKLYVRVVNSSAQTERMVLVIVLLSCVINGQNEFHSAVSTSIVRHEAATHWQCTSPRSGWDTSRHRVYWLQKRLCSTITFQYFVFCFFAFVIIIIIILSRVLECWINSKMCVCACSRPRNDESQPHRCAMITPHRSYIYVYIPYTTWTCLHCAVLGYIYP